MKKQKGFVMLLFFFGYVFVFLLLNAFPACGAFFAASAVAKGGRTEVFALTLLIWLLEALSAFGLLAFCGFLDTVSFFVLFSAFGGILACVSGKKRKPLPESAPFTVPERFAICLLLFFLLQVFISTAVAHGGTDSFLYHLYYPSMWITQERFTPVTLPGLPHEYFPMYGEFLYGWLMMPLRQSFFTGFLQPLAMLMASFSMMSLAETCHVRRLDRILSVSLLLSFGLIFKNTVMAYTDALTGAFLLTGVSLLLTGLIRRDDDRILLILAGITLGCTAGIKYSGLLAAPLMCCCILFLCLFRKEWQIRIPFCAVPAVLAALPAYMNNWICTGNPVYPVKIPYLFPQGFSFERSPVFRYEAGICRFFLTGDEWGMNLFAVILLFLILAAFLYFVCRNRNFSAESLFFYPVSAGCLLLFLIHLFFYPAMAQVRQFIPCIMVFFLLLIPLCQALPDTKVWQYGKCFSVILCSVLITSFSAHAVYTLILFVLCFALCLLKSKAYLRMLTVLPGIFFLALPFLFHLQFSVRNAMTRAFTGPAHLKAVEIVAEEYIQQNRAVHIAATGTWHNYMFLENMPGNQLFAVSSGMEETTHPHEVKSPEELRSPACSYDVWLERLKQKKASYLAVDLVSHADFLNSRRQELDWALAHPETFRLLAADDNFYFFRIVITGAEQSLPRPAL